MRKILTVLLILAPGAAGAEECRTYYNPLANDPPMITLGEGFAKRSVEGVDYVYKCIENLCVLPDGVDALVIQEEVPGRYIVIQEAVWIPACHD